MEQEVIIAIINMMKKLKQENNTSPIIYTR